ncbi:MAG: RidA family protein [Myxococcota bacterium]|nr:RidA family protein [Deltaproteobacteria bacterium]MDQ3340743.1 RidA family protein [Myxococcota bacterium]
MVFISAQVSMDGDNKIIAQGDPEGQVRRVWHNLDLAMKAAGGSLQDIVACWTYITRPEYSPIVSKVRTEIFPKNPPTTSRTIVVNQVTGIGPELLVSIQAMAIIPAR